VPHGPTTAAEPLGQRLWVSVENLPVLLLFLGKVVLPLDLAVLAHARDGSYVPGAAALVVIAVTCIERRGPRLRDLWVERGVLFGLGMFVLLLLPTLPVSKSLILENRLYLPTVGVLLAVSARLKQLEPKLKRHPALLAVGGGVALLFALRAFFYADDFRDRFAFGSACIRQSPHSSLAQLTAGNAYAEAGELDRAERAFRTALELEPGLGNAHNNLGVVFMRRGRLVEAEQELRQELIVNPKFDRAHTNLGLVLNGLGRADEAVVAWKRTLELSPDDLEANGELWAHYRKTGDAERAAYHERELVRLGMRLPPEPGVLEEPRSR
jgi:hypothetical protein